MITVFLHCWYLKHQEDVDILVIKRLATMIATDREEARSHLINHIRAHVRFALLKWTLITLRGVRGPMTKTKYLSVNDISFNLIPSKSSYEMPWEDQRFVEDWRHH
jgi:hypothetical protein